jgi:hypothetical protein
MAESLPTSTTREGREQKPGATAPALSNPNAAPWPGQAGGAGLTIGPQRRAEARGPASTPAAAPDGTQCADRAGNFPRHRRQGFLRRCPTAAAPVRTLHPRHGRSLRRLLHVPLHALHGTVVLDLCDAPPLPSVLQALGKSRRSRFRASASAGRVVTGSNVGGAHAGAQWKRDRRGQQKLQRVCLHLVLPTGSVSMRTVYHARDRSSAVRPVPGCRNRWVWLLSRVERAGSIDVPHEPDGRGNPAPPRSRTPKWRRR